MDQPANATAAGEEECGRDSFGSFLERRALEIYQVDLARNGFADAVYLRQRIAEVGARPCNHRYTSPVTWLGSAPTTVPFPPGRILMPPAAGRVPFQRYRLRLEYRFGEHQATGAPLWARRNSGIMLLCPPPEMMTLDQHFPVSVEVQLLGGDGTHPRSTANVCTPGTTVMYRGERSTNHCMPSASPTFHGDQWVRVEAEVSGCDMVRHYVNGSLVLEYGGVETDAGEPLVGRYIALQAESHEVEYRRIQILGLNDAEGPLRAPSKR